MDRITKFLAALSAAERRRVEAAIRGIVGGDFGGLDLKKLKGVEGVYRVRAGSVRILFFRAKGGIRILRIERRSDTTY